LVTRTYKTGGAGTNGIVNAGTVNRISKYTAATTLGNSSITDDGTTVTTAEAFSQGGGGAFALNSSGVPIETSGVALAGLGYPLLVKAPTTLTGQVAAVTNFINYTPPAAVGDYMIVWSVDTTTATTDSFKVLVTYTNSIGTARSQNSGGFDINGTSLVAGAITNVIGAGNYYGTMIFSIDNSATAITLSTAGTFTTVAYTLTAKLYRI